MLSHGVVSAALFLDRRRVYDRMHSREIARYTAAWSSACRPMRLVFMIFMLASVGLPGTGGFVGEFLVLVGAFQVNTWVALPGGHRHGLGAAYMLYLYRRVIFGVLTKDSLARTISRPEPARGGGLRAAGGGGVWMGIYPMSFPRRHVGLGRQLGRELQSALAAAEADEASRTSDWRSERRAACRMIPLDLITGDYRSLLLAGRDGAC